MKASGFGGIRLGDYSEVTFEALVDENKAFLKHRVAIDVERGKCLVGDGPAAIDVVRDDKLVPAGQRCVNCCYLIGTHTSTSPEPV